MVDLPTPPFPDETAMIFFTSGKGFSGFGRAVCLAFTAIFPLIFTSGLTKVRMAVSAAFTTDLINGSFGFSKKEREAYFVTVDTNVVFDHFVSDQIFSRCPGNALWRVRRVLVSDIVAYCRVILMLYFLDYFVYRYVFPG